VGDLASRFILGAETPGADIDFLRSTVYHDCGSMNIGQPAPLGMFLGVAYAITKLSSLATDSTLHKSFLPPLYYEPYFHYYTCEYHIRQRGEDEN
jgi:hypothetical protein